MKKQLVVIKFGGSLLTDKSKPLTTRPDVIASIAEDVAALYRTQSVDMLLGTGAGSFGHFSAHEYELRSGATSAKQFYGMCVTHSEVRQLNARFVEALIQKEVPAFAFSPAAALYCDDKLLRSTSLDPLVHLLQNGCVPVLHGDTICDSVRGTTILSTEEVLLACLPALKDRYSRITIIYAMNKPGILDADGAVIPEMTADSDISVLHTADHDVTGGILSKLQAARSALNFVDVVHIVGGQQPGTLQKVINGGQVGTRVIKNTSL